MKSLTFFTPIRFAEIVGVCLLSVSTVSGEHLGDQFSWMSGTKGKLNQSCCGVADCVETTVALLSQEEIQSTVMIGDTMLALPTQWIHPSRGHSGVWCFVPDDSSRYTDMQGRPRALPPKIPTLQNTRCAFYLTLN